MKNQSKYLILFFVTLLITNVTYSQSKAEKKLLKKARKELAIANYPGAKSNYEELLKLAPTNSEYLFEAGLAYYNSRLGIDKAIEHFENSQANFNGDTIAETLYYLGRAYQYKGDFDKAITQYKLFKNYLENNDFGVTLNRDVDRYIAMCNNGKGYVGSTRKDISVINLGDKVNTIFPEYAPVITKDESLMLFTGRKVGSTGGKFYNDDKYYEDIYITTFDGENWVEATKADSTNKYLSEKINSKWHDAAISFSADENKLFIYRKNDVWVSERNNGKWQEPIRLNKNINSKGHEPSAYTCLLYTSDAADEN